MLEEAFVCFTGAFSEACFGVHRVLLMLVCCCLLHLCVVVVA